MAVIDQINTRVDPAVKARYDAAAAALDVPASQIYRELLEQNLADIEKRAEEAARKRGGWQGGIPQHAIEAAVQRFMRSVARNEPLRLEPRDLYSADAKALWLFLSWIWSEGEADDAKVRAKLAKWLESLNIKAEVTAFSVPSAKDSSPESKSFKSYPRREG